jgi:protease IV
MTQPLHSPLGGLIGQVGHKPPTMIESRCAPMLIGLLYSLLRNLVILVVSPLLWLRRKKAAPKGGWVWVKLEGTVQEIAHPRPWFTLDQQPRVFSLTWLRKLVKAVIEDPHPVGVVISVENLRASAAHRTAIVNELNKLRDAGREVVIHLPRGGSSGPLLLACAASRFLIGTRSTLGPLGFTLGGTYTRKALDQLGIIPDIHAQGHYKTAGEGLVRTSMSSGQREQLGRMLDVLFEELVGALARGRKTTPEQAKAWLDKGLCSAEDAVKIGLADQAIHDDELFHWLGKERSETPADYVDASDYVSRRTRKIFKGLLPRPHIAVVEVHGAIVEHSMVPMEGMAADDTIVKLLKTVREDPTVMGLVLHVDSPGGGVLASDKIHRAVAKVAEKKPVVACMGSVAASGGYYVSAPAHEIVAEPTTITGSIGVVAARVVAGPLLAKLGVHVETLVRGARADLLDATRSMREDERLEFDAFLEQSYQDFIQIVAKGRHRDPADILPLAGGRVWMGKDALENGLVDALGGIDLAIEKVRQRIGPLGKFAEVSLIMPPRQMRINPMSLLRMNASLKAAADSLGFGPALQTVLAFLGTNDPLMALWMPWL